MNRIFTLSACAITATAALLITATSADAKTDPQVTLFGFVEGVKTDGAFPAKVVFKDPITGETLAQSNTLVDIKNGEYRADAKVPRLDKATTLKIEMEGLGSAEDFRMVDYVQLQSTTPGTKQTGHLDISGYVLASRIGLGVSPTIARLQINETGTAQGVRSITDSGVAVYGQANADTGLASGGYFTTSSVGGRAMVGDALSTTGSTVGGLFYNRSSDGVAVWGRHINSTGNSIGVFGQTASASGTAVLAQNTNTGDTVEIAGPNGSILTSGTLPSYEYKTNEIHPMVPIAYGTLNGNSSIITGSGNFAPFNVSAGKSRVFINDFVAGLDNTICVVTPENPGVKASVTFIGGAIQIATTNNADEYFGCPLFFVVFTTDPYSPTTRFQRSGKSMINAKKVDVPIPYDEGEPAGQPMNHVLPPRD